MKNLHLVILFLLYTIGSVGQNAIQVTPLIQPPYSPYLTDYTALDGKLLIQVTNLTNQPQEIIIKASLTGDNGINIFTGNDYAPPSSINLGPNESRTFSAIEENQQFLDPYQIVVEADDRVKNSILTTGLIPEGIYTLCLRAFDYNTNRPISQEQPAGCQMLPITYVQPPTMMSPMCGDSVLSEYPVFSWTPPLGNTGLADIEYDLYILPLVGDQNPNVQMELAIDQHAGNPVIIRDLNATNYVYGPSDIELQPGLHAVTVIARDRNGEVYFENNGRSEICLIKIGSAEEVVYSERIRSSTVHPGFLAEDVQLLKQSTLEGRLLYCFYEDKGVQVGDGISKDVTVQSGNINATGSPIGGNATGSSTRNVMFVENGNSLQNQSAKFSGQPLTSGYAPPPPPQYVLPAGYSTMGGKPLKQAGVKFTARFAVGKSNIISQPEDLIFISGSSLIEVTGAQLEEPLIINELDEKVIATTTTDDDGRYQVSFMSLGYFGVVATGPVEVTTGSKEFVSTVSGQGLYRVITMEVEEKWYCHPDVVLFVQPGQSLSVPDQLVLVQSYNLSVKVTSKEGLLQAAGVNNPIPDVVVKLGRRAYIHDNAPECFPKDEANIEQFGQMWDGSPFNTLMVDSLQTGAQGTVFIQRLVKHDGGGGCGDLAGNYWPDDGYYLEAYSHPNIGGFNYSKNSVSKLAPCGARLPIFYEDAPRSNDYQPPVITYEMKLSPALPEMRVNTRVTAINNAPYNLPHTTLLLSVYDENESHLGNLVTQTDQNGLFSKQFLWPADVNENLLTLKSGPPKQVTSRYVLSYGKPGYKNDNCNTCGTLDNKQNLQWGQKWNVEPFLLPNSQVRGKVEDEHGQSMYADVKIGDGPYLPVDMMLIPESGDTDDPVFEDLSLVTESLGSVALQSQNQGLAGTTRTNPASASSSRMVSQGGQNIQYQNGPFTTSDVDMVSVFLQSAPSGTQIPVIIRPDATNYFPDTFYVEIPEDFEGSYFDLGTFVIKEKLHRPKIYVYDQKLPVLNNNGQMEGWTLQYEENVEVTVSNLPSKKTNTQGFTQFIFGSPSNEFRVRIDKEGFVPIEEYFTIPVTKDPYVIEIQIDEGRKVSGVVSNAVNNSPISGARIFAEIDNNEYGPVLLETFSDSSGYYELNGLPDEWMFVEAAKTGDPENTYIGQKSEITPIDSILDFELEVAPIWLTHIWNLPVELESVEQVTGGWSVDGAFVDIPENDRFTALKESQRLEFSNLLVKTVDSTTQQEKTLVQPVSSHIYVNTSKFQSVLNGTHIVEMTGPGGTTGQQGQGIKSYVYNDQFKPVTISNIRIDKAENGNGLVKTRAFSMLEWFRFTYDYDGQFYLGETPENRVITSFKGKHEGNQPGMPDIYYLMTGNNWQNQITGTTGPDFQMHGFPSVIDKYESYVRQDSMILSTKLMVDLPLSNPDHIIVSAGKVIVLPDNMIVNQGDQPLEFDLENWHVRTGTWSFDEKMGGIVTSAVISTDLLEFPAPYVVIKTTSLKLPSASQINLDQLTLGGVVDMDIKPGAQLLFDYVNSTDHSPGEGHWRIVLSHPQQGQTVAGIQGLPGWPDLTEIGIRFIENFSDSYRTLILAPDQTVNHYNILKQTVSNIYLYEDGVSFEGNTDLEIPNLPTGYTANFVYTKEQNQVELGVLGLNTTFETLGKVEFIGDQQSDRIILDWDYFEVIGGLTIYEDETSNEIPLRANLIKEPGDIRIEIIDVDNEFDPELEGPNKQIIVLGDIGNSRQRVLEGSQHVSGNQWNELKYHAQFENFGDAFEGEDAQDKMWFVVKGQITNDPNAGDAIQLSNIKSPFGDFSLVFHLDEMVIDGSLYISNIPMGSVYVNEGTINMRMGAPGFFVLGQISAVYPFIGTLNTNFITGSYPSLPSTAKFTLKQNMYIKKLPGFLDNTGIQGLYMSANKPFFNGGFGPFPIPPVAVDVYADAGIDARFWFNFGDSYGGAGLSGLAYANVGMAVYSIVPPCKLCAGVMAELGFSAAYQWEPSTLFEVAACGAIGLSASFCGIADFSESAKLEMEWNSDGDFDVYVDVGSTCSGNDGTSQNDKGCD